MGERAAWIVGAGLLALGLIGLVQVPPLRAGDKDQDDPPSAAPVKKLEPRPEPTPKPKTRRRPRPTPKPEREEDSGTAERDAPAARGQDSAEMVSIPAGWFAMGSDDGASGEKPTHRVWVDAFAIDRDEVTNRRYRVFLQATGHGKPSYWDDARFNAPEQPVVGVSWDDAQAFCRWAGKRLPTEAEWERAARGGLEGKTYPWGDAEPSGRACYGQDFGTGRPSSVGRYAANGFGLRDIAGNASEWCADWSDEKYYGNSPDRNPRGASSGPGRVVRGGSWGIVSYGLRCADRGHGDPTVRFSIVGFRCARSL